MGIGGRSCSTREGFENCWRAVEEERISVLVKRIIRWRQNEERRYMTEVHELLEKVGLVENIEREDTKLRTRHLERRIENRKTTHI